MPINIIQQGHVLMPVQNALIAQSFKRLNVLTLFKIRKFNMGELIHVGETQEAHYGNGLGKRNPGQETYIYTLTIVYTKIIDNLS